MKSLVGVNLIIISGSESVQNFLREVFTKQGANVTLCGFLNMDFVSRIEQQVTADVILIDMDNTYDEDDAALDRLLDVIDLPILFHENTFAANAKNGLDSEHGLSSFEVDKIRVKLADLANKKRQCEQQKSVLESDAEKSSQTAREHESKESAANIFLDKTFSNKRMSAVSLGVDNNTRPNEAINVWVLGASIGGPEAVKNFLTGIPEKLPVAFVLAQHLGDGFVPLLVNQLNAVSCFKVKEGVAGDYLRHGEVIIVPVNEQMMLDGNGCIQFIEKSWEGYYKPSIDAVIDTIINYYQQQSGVIIFSGMGADGVRGCQRFYEQHTGKIWAQSSDTCVISSMPDSVRKAGMVSYSGSPDALALELGRYYMAKDFP